MRIMLDTNILVSIIIFNSKQLKELLVVICDNYRLVLSSTIINELEIVMERKFPDKKIKINEFLNKIPYELVNIPSIISENEVPKIRDVKDVPILYSAIFSNIDIFITGDKDFYEVQIKKPQIMSVSDFFQKYIKCS